MKYGILYNQSNLNLGDDIQAYATAQFLPQVDYLIHRESMPNFETDDGKPVAVIMSAWYMWKKWNWPPSKYIYPLFVGFHYADHQLSDQPGSPIKYEFLTGEGAAYLNAWGPVGARDLYTLEHLKANGIDSYFSGCITLTLPKQKIEDRGRYVCVVDVDENVKEKIRKDLAGSGIEVKVLTHTKPRDTKKGWEERRAEVEERLTIYQNALCVVTKKLHCALPCLAMEVPVLLVKDMTDDIRFSPYYDYLYHVRPKDFLGGDIDYDIKNPPANKPDYLATREELIKSCREFVASVEGDERSADEANRYGASEETILSWRVETARAALAHWKEVLSQQAREYSNLQQENRRLMKKSGQYKKTYPFKKRMDHLIQRITDSTYRQLVPDYSIEEARIEEKLVKEFGGRPEEGIEKLRFDDKKQRRMANRLMYFSKLHHQRLKAIRAENLRLKKGRDDEIRDTSEQE